jgi:hypothetical protein
MIAENPQHIRQQPPPLLATGSRPAVQRFTVDGSEALEHRLEALVKKVHHGVLRITGDKALQGLLLGGGYGRGEGGVLRTAQDDLPYNDLEFYVFLRGPLLKNRRKYQHLLNELSEELSHEAGLEVELKVFSLQKLRTSSVSMFFYDLLMGHRWVHGNEELLAGCAHHGAGELIPLHEATRLLMNRCSGLLLSAEYLQRPQFAAPESDFVNRNLHKLRLALGDAVLTSHGQYHWTCQERHRRLHLLNLDLSWYPAVLAEHARGVEFKLHPFQSTASRTELEGDHKVLSDLAQQVWLWLEGKRLVRNFGTPAEYITCKQNKCPETSAFRNLLLNVVYLRRNALAAPWRHPRQRVLNALTILLWLPLDATSIPSLQRLLATKSADFPSLIAAYRALWSRVN